MHFFTRTAFRCIFLPKLLFRCIFLQTFHKYFLTENCFFPVHFFRCILASLCKGVSVAPSDGASDGPLDGWSVRRSIDCFFSTPIIKDFIFKPSGASKFVLYVLNVLNVSKEASLACWALFYIQKVVFRAFTFSARIFSPSYFSSLSGLCAFFFCTSLFLTSGIFRSLFF